MSKVELKLQTLPHFKGLDLPAYQSEQAAGFDLPAAISEDIILAPLQRVLVPTGLIIELPEGYEAQVRPRSGLAIKNGISVLNAPGTIDSDYRGEVQVILINLSAEHFTISRGMRIAQMVIAPVCQAALSPSEQLSASERGSGGFGHSGL